MTRHPRSLVLVALATLALAGPALAAAGTDADADAGTSTKKKVVVHLTSYTDDLHKALMAVKLAWGMQHRGAQVTLFLDVEGVRIADERQPNDLRWGTSGALSDHWDTFIAEGGRVVLCRHCAKAAGIAEENLREGAVLDDGEQLPRILLDADLILDY